MCILKITSCISSGRQGQSVDYGTIWIIYLAEVIKRYRKVYFFAPNARTHLSWFSNAVKQCQFELVDD